MEREKELVKLINVLRRTSRMALQSEWTGGKEDAAAFCTDQYNRVFTRLAELEPAVKPLFTPLSESASPEVTRMAARELLAYFEADEPEFPFARRFFFRGRGWRGRGRCVPLSVTCE